MKIRSWIALSFAFVSALVAVGCAADEDTSREPDSSAPAVAQPEPVAETQQAAGQCPESIFCNSYHNGYNLQQIYPNCDGQGDLVNLTCKYWDNFSYVVTPSSTKCNECTINTSQGVAPCNQWTLTTYMNGSCQSG